MSALGVKIDQFSVPVCNSFKAKILNDQLCYEVDLNKYFTKELLKEGLELGLTLLIDYNLDRQIHTFSNRTGNDKNNLASKFKLQHKTDTAQILIEAIGNS